MSEDKIVLPQEFEKRMKALLGSEYEAFARSYERERSYGLRYNPLKCSREAFLQSVPFSLEKVPWAAEGFYYRNEERPGKHPLHEQGLYYIQEPSAMAVVEILDPKPGEKILDLCAAPGGKTTMIAGRMQGEGVLVTNEIVPNRAKILAQNVERMGITNAIVCNHSPQELELHFTGYFDRIVVDAPCSGEGMFHKEEQALTEWSEENVRMCAKRQKEILECAVSMLAVGGRLVYSTCTFAPEEDEQMVAWLLAKYPQLQILPIDFSALSISPARSEWIGEKALSKEPMHSIEHAARIWPHLSKGEGHFIACFERVGDRDIREAAGIVWQDMDTYEAKTIGTKKKEKPKGKRKMQNMMLSPEDAWKSFEAFAFVAMKKIPVGKPVLFGEQLYLLPQMAPDLTGLRVLRPGLHLGVCKQDRFEPSHALALAMKPEAANTIVETTEPQKYIAGESIPCDIEQKGWLLVTYQNQPLGFGKASGGIVKNHYPKGLRRNLQEYYTGRDL